MGERPTPCHVVAAPFRRDYDEMRTDGLQGQGERDQTDYQASRASTGPSRRRRGSSASAGTRARSLRSTTRGPSSASARRCCFGTESAHASIHDAQRAQGDADLDHPRRRRPHAASFIIVAGRLGRLYLADSTRFFTKRGRVAEVGVRHEFRFPTRRSVSS